MSDRAKVRRQRTEQDKENVGSGEKEQKKDARPRGQTAKH